MKNHLDLQQDFTPRQKNMILKRGDYKCDVCGKGKDDNVGLVVDICTPKSKGGKYAISNGRVLCEMHKAKLNIYGQVVFAKPMFIGCYLLAKEHGNKHEMAFFYNVLEIYEEYGIDPHAVWAR